MDDDSKLENKATKQISEENWTIIINAMLTRARKWVRNHDSSLN